MGTIYCISCRDCKVTRDLDKFYQAQPVTNKAEASELAASITKDSWRAALTVSFLAAHAGHHCVFFNEHHESLAAQLDPDYPNDFSWDTDYWSST